MKLFTYLSLAFFLPALSYASMQLTCLSNSSEVRSKFVNGVAAYNRHATDIIQCALTSRDDSDYKRCIERLNLSLDSYLIEKFKNASESDRSGAYSINSFIARTFDDYCSHLNSTDSGNNALYIGIGVVVIIAIIIGVIVSVARKKSADEAAAATGPYHGHNQGIHYPPHPPQQYPPPYQMYPQKA